MVLKQTVELLWWLRTNGFTQHLIGGEHPTVMVFSRSNGGYLDLAHIRGEDRAEAARIPIDEFANIWQPKISVWHYYGDIIDVLTQLIVLPAPDEPTAPRFAYAVPRSGSPPPLLVSDAERKQKTIVRAPLNASARGDVCGGTLMYR